MSPLLFHRLSYSNPAINDIINNPRFQGHIQSISGVTEFMDTITVTIITFIAFFIISAAFIRNCIAGAYAAYPKWFDKVNEAKEAGEGLKGKGPKGVGTIAAFLLRLLPDFKALSDFKDDNIEPRDYFIKAIPQMFIVIMIGMCIYNGYYRDIAAKVGMLGSELIHRFIVDVDPIEVWDRMTNSIGAPTLSSDADKTTKGKFVNSIAKDLYSQTVSFYTDIKGVSAKNKLSSAVENWTYSTVGTIDAKYFNGEQWKPTYQLIRRYSTPKLNAVTDDPTERYVKQFSVPVSALQIDSAMHKETDWCYELTCTFVKKHSGVKKVGNVSVDMIVGSGAYKRVGSGDVRIVLQNNNSWAITAMAQATADGRSYNMTIDGNYLVIKGLSEIKGEIQVAGLSYTDSNQNSHTIQSITVSGGGNISFKFNTSDGKSGTFKEGQAPPAK